ncbi:hypothetical protein [Microbispora sitophila]|uniref:hypothetical protein n=1 Tax=Microbispora sitophila TaxID=2771537 RepID=UPI001D01AE08|nr:hypothetical protein [Microbispora sitophila]
MRETRRTARARVVAHTCDYCSPLAYELCASGGLLFVRRTSRTDKKPEVRETERLPDPQARRL